MEDKNYVLTAEEWIPSASQPGKDTPACVPVKHPDLKASFLTKLFCKPTTSKQSQIAGRDNSISPKIQYRFSFLSRGCLVLSGVIVLLVGVVIAILAAVLLRHPRARSISQIPIPGSPSSFVPASPIQRTNLHGVNFPDPFLHQSSGKWFAYATNDAAGILGAPNNTFAQDYGQSSIQLATSTDLVNWVLSSESNTSVLPDPGDWSLPGTHIINDAPPVPRASVWAPDLYQRTTPQSDFLLYYSAVSSANPNRHCIGVASFASSPSSPIPSGPFQPTSPNPLICPLNQGGAIDAAIFTDTSDSTTPPSNSPLYLLYKIDGNTLGHGGICGNTVPPLASTPIMLQALDPSGLNVSGSPITLSDREPSDGPLIEAPTLVKSDQGVYFLFFSSGCTRSDSYDVKYATAEKIDGPYTRAAAPLLKSGDYGGLVAPGSVSVVRSGSGWVMAFAARVQSQFGGVRELFVTGLELEGKVAKVVKLGSS